MPAKMTAPRVRAMKEKGERIVCVTAYDFPSAWIAEEAGVDVVLVGDSVGNVVLGYDSTVPVTMEEMAHHVRAVRRATKLALLVADLPFGSYHVSTEQAVESACRLMKQGGEAIKLEGAYPDAIAAMTKAGIPVMGHVGMTPQSVHAFGGFRVQGRGEEADHVIEQALAVEDAGAFAIVLELIPAELAASITSKLRIPTIGIGAGPHCDGQIQVFHDLIGLSDGSFKHAKAYVDGREILGDALARYVKEVRNLAFPTDRESF